MKSIKNLNLSEFLLIGMIVVLIGGMFGGPFQFIRIYSIVILLYSLQNKKFITTIVSEKLLFQYFLLFLFFSIGNTMFLVDVTDAIKDIIYVIINFLIIFQILFLSKNTNRVGYIVWYGVNLFVLLTLPIAFYEIILDKHLSVSLIEGDRLIGGIGTLKRFASVTFGNYNQYNYILAFLLPFIAAIYFKPLNSLNIKYKYLAFINLVAIVAIVIINGSRGALASILISLLILFFYLLKNSKRVNFVKILFGLIILVSTGVTYLMSTGALDYLLFRLTSGGFEDTSRSDLILAGFEILVSSNFIGVGPANFMNSLMMLASYKGDILPPHNLFIEILSQYGIFVFALFLAFLLKIYLPLKNWKQLETLSFKYVVLCSLLTLFINTVINSGYYNAPYIWVNLGLVYIFSKLKYA